MKWIRKITGDTDRGAETRPARGTHSEAGQGVCRVELVPASSNTGFEPLDDGGEGTVDARKRAWARLLAKVYEIDPLDAALKADLELAVEHVPHGMGSCRIAMFCGNAIGGSTWYRDLVNRKSHEVPELRRRSTPSRQVIADSSRIRGNVPGDTTLPRQGCGGREADPAEQGPKRSGARSSPVGPQGRGARLIPRAHGPGVVRNPRRWAPRPKARGGTGRETRRTRGYACRHCCSAIRRVRFALCYVWTGLR